MRSPVLTALAAFAITTLAGSASAQTLPPGFEAVPLPHTGTKPVELAFAPDGTLFVALQKGRVRIHRDHALQSAFFLDLTDEVNENHDRGMLGITLARDFVADGGPNSWVYLLYTVSPVPGQDMEYNENDQYSFSRLTRYRAITSGDDIVADVSSRQVLLGNQLPDGSVPDGIASVHSSHSNGSLHIADDGSLLVATGDGAHFDFIDTGGNDDPAFDDWTHPVTGLKGPTPAVQDSGSFRSQDLRSLSGKILRIDPETGLGYASNPFFDGDAASNPSRVWALGLRNPFRVMMIPDTGAKDPALGQPNTLVIGDVGDGLWEEMNVCDGGENFGWPCLEGTGAHASFTPFNPPAPQFPNCNTPKSGVLTDPLVAFHHWDTGAAHPPGTYMDEAGTPLAGYTGVCGIGGELYTGGQYPDLYDGRIFFGDFGFGWINTLELDPALNVVAVRPFASSLGTIVDIARNPITGDLYYIQVFAGTIYQIRYADPAWVTSYGCGVNPAGSLTLADDGVFAGTPAELALHNPLGTQAPGAATALGMAIAPDPAFPCGSLLSGFGMTGTGADGELLLSLLPSESLPAVLGPLWTGAPTSMTVPVPFDRNLIGMTIYLQGVLIDPTFGGGGGGAGIALTDGLEVTIGS